MSDEGGEMTSAVSNLYVLWSVGYSDGFGSDLDNSSIFVCCVALLLGLNLLQPEKFFALQLVQLTLERK